MVSSRAFFLLLFLIAQTHIYAQNVEKKTIDHKQEILLLESIVEDANKLRLPENKAFVYAEAGKKFCYIDKNRAGQLFQKSLEEIIKSQKEKFFDPENRKNYQNFTNEYNQRSKILTTISYCDGEIALDLLTKSRPKPLQDVFSESSGDTDNLRSSYQQEFVKQEKDLENRFKQIAAEQNPNLAVEYIRSSLRDGNISGTLHLIKRLHGSDPKIAKEFAEEAGGKLLSTKSSDWFRQIYDISRFLDYFAIAKIRENADSQIVSESLIFGLADKISQFWLERNARPNEKSNAYRIVEKLFPERLAQLRENREKIKALEVQLRLLKANPADREEVITNNKYDDFISSNPSVEELISQAANFPGYKRPLYIKAAEKLASQGKVTEAVNLLRSNFSQEEFPKQFTTLFYNTAYSQSGKGNYLQAISLLDLVTIDSERARGFAVLARSINYNKPTNTAQLIPIVLEKVRNLPPKNPQTVSEVETLLNVVEVYSFFEPPRAFQILSNIIPTLDEFAKARAVANKFLEKGNIKNGEHLFSQYDDIGGLYKLTESLKALKNKDFQRTLQFIDKFGQLEDRIYIKLHITEMQLK